LLMVLAAGALIIILIPLGLGWLTFYGVTRPPCGVSPQPDAYNLSPEVVTIPARIGAEYRGYFFSGANGATIIVPPAYGQDRGGWLHEVDVLVRSGYSVLTYDSRPCTGIAPHSLGIWEAEDILDAVTYLQTRPDVDMSRLGLHGFSQAGASNLFAAARSDRIRAVVAEGGYVDYGAQTLSMGQEQDFFTALFSLGARISYRLSTGLNLADLRVLDHLPDIAPGRVLLVYGEHEVTLAGARDAAARHAHIDLWEVPDATHGSYLASAGEAEFTAHIVAFFDDALAPPD
jgi:dienelactone hydrolase